LSELPSLKEFEEIKRLAFGDAEQVELLPGMEEAVGQPERPQPGSPTCPTRKTDGEERIQKILSQAAWRRGARRNR